MAIIAESSVNNEVLQKKPHISPKNSKNVLTYNII